MIILAEASWAGFRRRAKILVLCPFDEKAWAYHVSRGRELG
jgi:hypothetical protein